jgi:hypothetical protein
MKIVSSLFAAVVLVAVVGPAVAIASEPSSSNTPPRGGPPPAIVNRTLDLLTESVVLEEGTDHATWHSREFDTSQFDTVALKIVTDAGSGPVHCEIAWKLGHDDEFIDPIPDAVLPTSVTIRSIQNPQVLGTSGKVFCRAAQTCGTLGCDRGDPPGPAVGTLTDVKVLLRRQ